MEIKIINTDKEILKAKKKSSIGPGKGTIIMAKIQTIKKTMVRLLALIIGAIKGPKNGKTKSTILFFLAIIFNNIR